MRRSAATVISPVYPAAPFVSVEVAPCSAGEREGVSDPRLKMWIRRLKAWTHRTAPRASGSEHRTITVIVRVVVALSIKSATAFMVSIWAVIICTFSGF